MCAALGIVNVVSKRHHIFTHTVVILNRHLNFGVLNFFIDVKDIWRQGRLACVQMLDIGFDAAVKVEFIAEGVLFIVAVVNDFSTDAFC